MLSLDFVVCVEVDVEVGVDSFDFVACVEVDVKS